MRAEPLAWQCQQGISVRGSGGQGEDSVSAAHGHPKREVLLHPSRAQLLVFSVRRSWTQMVPLHLCLPPALAAPVRELGELQPGSMASRTRCSSSSKCCRLFFPL